MVPLSGLLSTLSFVAFAVLSGANGAGGGSALHRTDSADAPEVAQGNVSDGPAEQAADPQRANPEPADAQVADPQTQGPPADLTAPRPGTLTISMVPPGTRCSENSGNEIVVCGRRDNEQYRLRPLPPIDEASNPLGGPLNIEVAPGVRIVGGGIKITF